MLQSTFLNEHDLKDFGFKSLGKNIRVSSDARIYGAENISLDDHSRIDDFAILSAVNGYINIGKYVHITRSCHLSGFHGIEMHDFSSMAAHTVMYSATDDYSGNFLTGQAIPQKYTSHGGGPIIIGKHVIIGIASSFIGPCNVGEGCSVGANTLMMGDYEPWGTYVGIPAKRIKERSRGLLKLEKEFLGK